MSNPFDVVDERNIAARPLRFFKEYKPMADGSMKEIEKVEWAPIGKAHNHTTRQTIKSMVNSPMWEPFFEKPYNAWKKGDDIPVSGTPLAAWSGVTPEQVEILKASQIYTVEELAALTSTIKSRLRLPNIDNLCHLAGLFVDSKDQRKFEEALAKKDSQMADMQGQMLEMQKRMAELLDAKSDDKAENDPPKRRGRPPKQSSDENETFQSVEVDEG